MKKYSVYFLTLGCAKNEVDTAAMKELVLDAGYCVVEDPDSASAIIVNTCSFIQAATEESLDAIFELAQIPNITSSKAKLIVCGCMVSRYGEDLKHELTEANAFVACSDEVHIVDTLQNMIGTPSKHNVGISEPIKQNGTNQVSAYVKISDGCDRFCSYCTIPYIRGRYHSFELCDIKQNCEKAISNGAKEIVLIAQDTGRWGQDFSPARDLSYLLNELANSYPETWFRIMYLQPEGLTEQVLQCVKSHKNICKYFDIPLQHVNPSILRKMNRTGSYDEFVSLIKHIKDEIPEITLRTTLIAGFPGETEEQFQELYDFVSEGLFDYVGVFAYSREDGTKAASLDDQIDEDIKLERAQCIRDLADSVSAPLISSRIGKNDIVLIEGAEDDGQLFGRCMSQAPEVDGVTYVDKGKIGEFVEVSIVDTMLYEMEGEVKND